MSQNTQVPGRWLTPVAVIVLATVAAGAAYGFAAPGAAATGNMPIPQQAASSATAPFQQAPPHIPPAVPFGVGEVMSYRLSARILLVSGSGEASLSVEAVDTVHGHPTYRLALQMRGGAWRVFNLNSYDRSWLDVRQLFSRRFHQLHRSTGDNRDRTYDFFPDRMRYVNPDNPEDAGDLANVRPLDIVSFLYHVRMLPLTVGRDYEEPRYFKAEDNPVTVQVLRSERIRVPAGEFDALVVRPIIRTDRLFGEGGQAEVWISNDPRRLLVKMRARLPGRGTITMDMQSYTPGTPVGTR